MSAFSFVLLLICLLYATKNLCFKQRVIAIFKGLLYAFALFAARKLAFWLNGEDKKDEKQG